MSAGVSGAPWEEPRQSPLYHAEHSERYERQALIQAYEAIQHCRLIVMIDAIYPRSLIPLEELLYDADPSEDLHLLLSSPGGDGETAIRIARSAQARCKNFTVVVPDQAKSAATLVALGAHHVLMGPISDLGPVDPQFFIGDQLVSAKNIIAAVDDAETRVQENPATYPIHASLLSDVNALMVAEARSELARSDELMKEALSSQPDRTPQDVEDLVRALHAPLVEEKSSHGAVFAASDAEAAGLPVVHADMVSPQWRMLWRLYAKYCALPRGAVYEGRKASQLGH